MISVRARDGDRHERAVRRVEGGTALETVDGARTTASSASVTLRDVAQGARRLDHDGLAHPQRPRIRRAHPRGDPRAGLADRRRAGLPAEPARARSARQPSSLLGVIARDIADPFHIQILQGINAAARRARLPDVPRERRLPPGGGARLRLDVRAVSRRRDHPHRRHPRRRRRAGCRCASSIATWSASPTGPARAVPGRLRATARRARSLALEHLWELGPSRDHVRLGRPDRRRPPPDRRLRALHARARRSRTGSRSRSPTRSRAWLRARARLFADGRRKHGRRRSTPRPTRPRSA